ncbi:sigma-70 family RNA polymerase sigma factor [Actinokineospora auranticolor]|uniref:RNA polymerase sigma-70 factor (ECF subfamily) n=1 Tax=Actinokineospora auranticolor TaxID=155976 RepID=A0A2S6GVD1_9PSEU|nr:sigma-70 family RNA polymerase sigma factor [Actinokineospora auranticolor]PPK69146.1 RNA polymerase sigma-70 factor (ECF subfamily) [Actinokineospora auranticolor]
MSVTDTALAERFSEHRDHLVGVAYRLTGSRSDAEDAVQEAWLRLSAVDEQAREGIRELRAWLTTVVGRLCLDRLRSATARRERYVGPWLPEPVVTPFGTAPSEDPLDIAVRDDGVRMAALVVLDRLTPEQRVALVLHDAFDLPFAEIAATLGCTDATARQHASRARRAVAQADPPPRIALEEQREVLERFVAAIAAGDLSRVVALLHPDAALIADSGGKARAARRSVLGPDNIARFYLGLRRRYDELVFNGAPILVNGDLGAYLPPLPAGEAHHGRDARVATFAIRDGLIYAIYDIANPDKLTGLNLPTP